VILSSA